jgi:hypothetical protein
MAEPTKEPVLCKYWASRGGWHYGELVEELVDNRRQVCVIRPFAPGKHCIKVPMCDVEKIKK